METRLSAKENDTDLDLAHVLLGYYKRTTL